MHFIKYSIALTIARVTQAMRLEDDFDLSELTFAQLSEDVIPEELFSCTAVDEAEF